MAKPKIFIAYSTTDPQFLPDQRERLRAFAELVENPHARALSDEEKRHYIRDVDGAALGRTGKGLTHDLIDAARNLKVIGLIGSGVKDLQPEYAMDKGITIFNTAAGFGRAVAEYAVALMFLGLRDIHYFASRMETEKWPKARRPHFDLSGKTVGLIGLGAVGRHTAHMLRGFDVKLLVCDPYVPQAVLDELNAESVDLETLLKQSQIVSVHCGRTDETRHMLGGPQLDMLQEHAVLVNTARGAVIDEQALAERLPQRRFIACLNVFDKEPLPEDSPLRGHWNCILTPHGGGQTVDAYHRNSVLLVDDFIRFFNGATPHGLVRRKQLARMT
ncbi:MAG: 3-phosphoglycerate dehydrogenase [Kiritimatiellae bacterium]|nr:3-phosphoglycerate dehydrogenase [Kiritimatiellia bacterium]